MPKSPSGISFLQNNVNKSSSNMTSCLQIAFEQKIDFILFQEPWINATFQYTVSHSSYYCFLPESRENRPRVAIFARKRSRFQLNQRPDLCNDSDLLVIDIIDTKNQLDPIQLVNIYNEKSQEEGINTRTIERALIEIQPAKYSIIAGDFNAHHSWWNSQIINSIRAEELVDWCLSYNLELINEPDLYTFHRIHGDSIRKSVIDLTFTTAEMAGKITDWYINSSSGLDYKIIQFSFQLDN
jgi:Endonuclease-reverse transcriptase